VRRSLVEFGKKWERLILWIKKRKIELRISFEMPKETAFVNLG